MATKTVNLVIRSEQQSDIAAIHAIHAASFPTDAEANLVDLLRQAKNLSVSLVAAVEEKLVGHVAFSPVTIANETATEVESQRGVNGIDWVVVLGEPAYYQRFGFVPATQYGLSDAYGGGAAFQAIELKPGGVSKHAGLVNYAPEFASLG